MLHSRRLKVAIVAPSMGILGGQAVQAARLVRAWHGDPDVHAWLVPINPVPPGPFAAAGQHQVPPDGCDPADLLAAAVPRAAPRRRRARVLRVLFLVPARAAARRADRPAAPEAGGHELSQRRRLPITCGDRRSRAARSRRSTATPSRRAFLQDVFARIRHRRPKSIPNIVDVDRFAFRRREPLRPKLLSTRNFEPLYNVACTLRAFRLVQDRYPDATLTLVGAGSEDEALRALAQSAPAAQRHVCGPRAARRHLALLRRCRHLPADAEHRQHAGSVLEAFASGCAVVATNAGGVPAILTDGVHGLLVDCDDHEAAAARILDLLARSCARARLTTAARESCEQYLLELGPLPLGCRSIGAGCGVPASAASADRGADAA